MIVEDQREVMAFLASPATHGGTAVERIETHASVVFLAGPRALKMKRAVRYDYLDFSTVERRKTMCDAELRINRRTAPALYRRVVAVTRERDGALALDGSGPAVEWLVEMARFDQDGLFDRLAGRLALELDLMRPLARAIARFHAAAEPRFDHGGGAGMAWVVEGNAAGFADQGASILDPGECAGLTAAAQRALEQHRALLDSRRTAGLVRQCHGDLHLRNIVLLDGEPTLFDGIEFNDEIACTDVLYDVAFLLMDLWRRGLHRHASLLWNAYLAETADYEGVPLLPLFLSCRAAVRAKTSATTATLQKDPRLRGESEDLAREYLTLAGQLLAPPPPCLIAVGGLSGSGKSTVAHALAPAIGAVPGAVVLRSDDVRKRICGVDPSVRLGPAGYTSEVSRRVYATLSARARVVIDGGHAAIVDAVWAEPSDRDAIEGVAAAAGVPFVGLWLEAPESTLIARVEQRRDDASDADAAVVRAQRAADVGPIRWVHVDAASTIEDMRQRTIAVLRTRVPATVHDESTDT